MLLKMGETHKWCIITTQKNKPKKKKQAQQEGQPYNS